MTAPSSETIPSSSAAKRQSLLARVLPPVLALYWLGMFGGTHWPKAPHPHVGMSDKWMHFGAFFGLALLVWAVVALNRPVTLARFGGIALGLAVYGALDEFTQPLVGRDCELLDWCADLTGVLLGSALFVLLAFAWRRFGRHAW